MELSKQEMDLFLLFPDLGSKNFFNKILTIVLRSLNQVSQTGIGIIQTGNEIIFPISRPRIKKLF